jgi:hypothetical protein
MSEPIDESALAALAEQRRQEQAREYGQYVAAQDIYHGGALAYTKGAAVPASNVAQYAYDQNGLVEPVERPPDDAASTEAPRESEGLSLSPDSPADADATDTKG